jgi:uncharacterized YigZ family protein
LTDTYPVPDGIHRVEEVVRGSLFVTTVARAPDAEAARAFVERITTEYPDATHVCWAFVAGPPGSTRSIGMSDAGEPHGTAGRPMLEVLLHGGVGQIVAVCARWFGGTKLGTGGLARAYASGVTRALESLPVALRRERSVVEIEVSYAHIDGVRRALEDLDAKLIEEDYGETVRYRAAVPVVSVAELRSRILDVSRGEGSVRGPER